MLYLLGVYRDCHIMRRHPGTNESLEQRLVGERELAQFGRLMNELGITYHRIHHGQGGM